MSLIRTKLLRAAAIGAVAGIAACETHKTVVESKTEAAPAAPVVVAQPTTSVETAVVVADEDIKLVKEYYFTNDCPAGFTKQAGMCVGAATSVRYVVGQPLAEGVTVIELPADLSARLRPLPEDHEYHIIDGDLVIVRKSTHVVLDADDLF